MVSCAHALSDVSADPPTRIGSRYGSPEQEPIEVQGC